jgi:hypothetical protein
MTQLQDEGMTQPLRDHLERKLAESFEQVWDQARPLGYEFDPEPRQDREGNLSVGLRFLVTRPDGTRVPVHATGKIVLNDTRQVDGFLADALSTVLMKHPEWPRR